MRSKFGRTTMSSMISEVPVISEKISNIDVVGTTTTFKGEIETETYPSLDDELDKIQNMIISGTKTIFAGDLETNNYASVDAELNKIPVINGKIQNITTDGTKTIFAGDVESSTLRTTNDLSLISATGAINLTGTSLNLNGSPFTGGGGGGGSVDNTNLVGDTAKVADLISGETEEYTAKIAIGKGQPVAIDIDSSILVTHITSATPVWRYLGIATNTAAIGETVVVCKKGFCNVKKTTSLQAPEIKLLNASTDNQTPIGRNFHLKDSGADGNYSSNEDYQMTFDCQDDNGWTMTFNNFAFEASTYAMYDRFSIRSTNTGANYSNVSIPWMHKSSTSSFPYSNSFAGSSWNSTSSKNGYILPKDTVRAILMGWNQQPLNIPDRFIRINFRSDGSSQYLGWDINLTANSYSGGDPAVIPYNTPLYLNESTYDRLTTTVGNHLFGYTASSNQSNDEIFSYII